MRCADVSDVLTLRGFTLTMDNEEVTWMEEERRDDGERRQACLSHKESIGKVEHRLDVQIPINRRFDNFIAQAKVIGIVFTLVYFGAFTYTYNHKQDSSRVLEVHRALIDSNSDRISNVQGDYKALFVRLDSLTREMQKANIQNAKLLDALLNERPHNQ